MNSLQNLNCVTWISAILLAVGTYESVYSNPPAEPSSAAERPEIEGAKFPSREEYLKNLPTLDDSNRPTNQPPSAGVCGYEEEYEKEIEKWRSDVDAFPVATHIEVNGKKYELKDGLTIKNQKIYNQVTITGQGRTLRNLDFSGCEFARIFIDEVILENCNFSNTVFRGGAVYIYGNGNNFTNAEFELHVPLTLRGDYLAQTVNYKRKRLAAVQGDLRNMDFSNCVFVDTTPVYCCSVNGSRFDNAYFEGPSPAGCLQHFSTEQFMQTLNYRIGFFHGFEFSSMANHNLLRGVDLSEITFSKCCFWSPMNFDGTRLNDAKFVDCIFTENVKNLTVEQIKSTWNYKNGRMDLIKLPPELQKIFDDEAAVKAEE